MWGHPQQPLHDEVIDAPVGGIVTGGLKILMVQVQPFDDLRAQQLVRPALNPGGDKGQAVGRRTAPEGRGLAQPQDAAEGRAGQDVPEIGVVVTVEQFIAQQMTRVGDDLVATEAGEEGADVVPCALAVEGQMSAAVGVLLRIPEHPQRQVDVFARVERSPGGGDEVIVADAPGLTGLKDEGGLLSLSAKPKLCRRSPGSPRKWAR